MFCTRWYNAPRLPVFLEISPEPPAIDVCCVACEEDSDVTVEASGRAVDVSGSAVNVSGRAVDVSGRAVDVSVNVVGEAGSGAGEGVAGALLVDVEIVVDDVLVEDVTTFEVKEAVVLVDDEMTMGVDKVEELTDVADRDRPEVVAGTISTTVTVISTTSTMVTTFGSAGQAFTVSSLATMPCSCTKQKVSFSLQKVSRTCFKRLHWRR